jgi:hypothetical protein
MLFLTSREGGLFERWPQRGSGPSQLVFEFFDASSEYLVGRAGYIQFTGGLVDAIDERGRGQVGQLLTEHALHLCTQPVVVVPQLPNFLAGELEVRAYDTDAGP